MVGIAVQVMKTDVPKTELVEVSREFTCVGRVSSNEELRVKRGESPIKINP